MNMKGWLIWRIVRITSEKCDLTKCICDVAYLYENNQFIYPANNVNDEYRAFWSVHELSLRLFCQAGLENIVYHA